jgi:hypothetical protein
MFGEGWGYSFGFAPYESTSRGYFRPTGVLKSEQGKGIGKELLVRSMVRLPERDTLT